MSNKPIFVATHPRAVSTAFERVFMTRRNTLQCIHEPFGDAYYFGPERLAARFEGDAEARKTSGYADTTYGMIFEDIEKAGNDGKRVFVKDMAQYWIPPSAGPATIAPSLVHYRRGVGTSSGNPNSNVVTNNNTNGTTNGNHPSTSSTALTNGTNTRPYPYPTSAELSNPTIMPRALLAQFHFTFLIRHPRNSIPSYFRCTVPPLDSVTGWDHLRPDEAGYAELRVFFDFLRAEGMIGPKVAGPPDLSNGVANRTEENGEQGGDGGVEICVIDADDLLDNPAATIQAYCKTTGLDYTPDMLKWDTEADHEYARETFEKWKGFHDDAIESSELRARPHKSPKSDPQLFTEWTAKFGAEGAELIRDTVAANVADYEYLKGFALKV